MFKKLDNLMFQDLGKKIKTLAKIQTWIIVGGFLVAAVVMGVMGGIFLLNADEDTRIAGIVLCLSTPFLTAAGIFFAWLSNLTLFGFGELIDKATLIEHNTSYLVKKDKSAKAQEKQVAIKTPSKSENLEDINFTISQNERLNPVILSRTDNETEDIEIEEEFFDVKCPVCNKTLSFIKGTKEAECFYCGSKIKIK